MKTAFRVLGKLFEKLLKTVFVVNFTCFQLQWPFFCNSLTRDVCFCWAFVSLHNATNKACDDSDLVIFEPQNASPINWFLTIFSSNVCQVDNKRTTKLGFDVTMMHAIIAPGYQLFENITTSPERLIHFIIVGFIKKLFEINQNSAPVCMQTFPLASRLALGLEG